jgi:hypothetical protein
MTSVETETAAMCSMCCHMVPKSDLTQAPLFYVQQLDRYRFGDLCKPCYFRARCEGWL